MYPITPPAVYVHERVLADPKCTTRMERLMTGIHSAAPPVVVDDAELDRISAERNWPDIRGRRTGELHRTGDPVVVFNRFRWADDAEFQRLRRQFPNIADWYMLGNGPWTFRDGRATLGTQHGVCQNAYELHSAWGCLHNCDYCNVGDFLNIMLDMEELVVRLDALVAANPWLHLYKYDNHTDIPAFEPEYGATRLLVEYFARQPGRYLMIYTKSANLGFLADLRHAGKTIVCWTLSCDTVSRQIEKKAPPVWERLDAMRLCQDAGYTVRARFSPIIPVRNWQQENAEVLEHLLREVNPDILTIDMFKWIDPRKVHDLFDVTLWDAEYLDCAERYAAMDPVERPRGIFPNGKQLFAHDLRARVYRWFIAEIRRRQPQTRIALCGETPEMWADLGVELGMTPADYVCACGPTSVPGHLPS